LRLLILASVLVCIPGMTAPGQQPAVTVSGHPDEFQPLPKPGGKVLLGSGGYFIFGFTRPPKLGTAIMKVEVFDRNGQRDTSFVIQGDVDMPSMRGAHTLGDKPFALSSKGYYLLPVPLVMPGDWEFRFTFVKDGKPVFRGAHRFDL